MGAYKYILPVVLVSILTILPCLANPHPKPIHLTQYTIDEGLSCNAVTAITQDSRGFLWIATQHGLNKFDGYQFTPVLNSRDPAYPCEITHITDMVIVSDSTTETLWMTMDIGHLLVVSIDLRQDRAYEHKDLQHLVQEKGPAWAIEKDQQNRIWIGLDRGLICFDPETGEHQEFLKDICINALFCDQHGSLWVGTWHQGVIRIDIRTGMLEQFLLIETENSNDSKLNDVESLFISSFNGKRRLWIGTRQGLRCLDIETGELVSITQHPDAECDLLQSHIYKILHHDGFGSDQLMVSAGGWLTVFDPGSGEVWKLNPAEGSPDPSVFRKAVFQDNTGSIWFGFSRGLFKINREFDKFTNYERFPDPGGEMINPSVTEVHGTAEGIWIGAGPNLYHLDERVETLSYIPTDARGIVLSLSSDKSGGLWIGTGSNTHRYDLRTGISRTFHQSDNAPFNTATIISARDGSLLFGTRGRGLYRYSPSSDQFTRGTASNVWVTDILQREGTEDQIIWLSSLKFGLIQVDLEFGDWVCYYSHDPSQPLSVNSDWVRELHEDHLGRLWLGTQNGLDLAHFHETGLDADVTDQAASLSINPKIPAETEIPAITFEHFYPEHERPGIEVRSITEDTNGQLWLGTNRGLFRFDPESSSFEKFLKQDGLLSNEFVDRAGWCSSDGRLYFGTRLGLTSFHPDSLRKNLQPPLVELTDFQVFHQSVPVGVTSEDLYTLPENIAYVDEVVLSYWQNVLSLDFTALDFHIPSKNQYAYMLEGFDQEWIHTDAKNRRSSYTNLDPGEYLFRVKASNNDGVWNEAGRSLAIIITPPWWKTKLAYGGYLVLGLAILTGLWLFQLNRIRIRHQLEMDRLRAERYAELDELKSHFFANISHEFRTPLTLILGPIEKWRQRIKDQELKQDLSLMQRHARRILDLVTQLLDLSKLEAGKMQLQASERNVVPLLKGLVLSFASLAERKNITLSFHSYLEKISAYVEKEALVKIVNNLLSNAFKFTPDGGEIEARLEIVDASDLGPDGELILQIRDNGIGIPADRLDSIFNRFTQVDGSEIRDHEGTGIGLALTKELVEMHKGKIGVESLEGEGSVFSIRLPLGSSHLSPDEIVQTKDDQKEEFAAPDLREPENANVEPPAKGSAKPLILIVEDNTDVRHYIRSYLDRGYRCMEALDGQDGLDQAIEKIPDLIISDVMMPLMDGEELCRLVKTDERISHIPIILLTAKADLDSKLKGLETGADSYLTKPFESRELQLRVRNLINQRQHLREHFQKELTFIPDELELASVDKRFLEKAMILVNENLEDPDFNVAAFSRQIHLSQQHLNRKLNALTGQSAQGFIRALRLKQAALLLRSGSASITEIAYQVGFSDPTHFSRVFRREFGVAPKQYQQTHT